MNNNSKLNSSKAINSKGTSGLEPKILPRKSDSLNLIRRVSKNNEFKQRKNTIEYYK